MSSTDRDEAARRALGSFFDEKLMPLSMKLRDQGVTLFAPGPDPTRESYFVTRPQPAMTREEFESPSCEDFDDFARRLESMWKSRGREDLAALSGDLAQLARLAYTLDEESAEVSPFVYVMF